MRKKKEQFDRLAEEAAACRICPRMAQEKAVLGPANGACDAPILFVAEAPGRFGAARTGIPFHGDRSGDNFEELLAHIGLTRKDVFITNAVLCNPLHNGKNSPPSKTEISNCSFFLQSLLNLVKPRLVVTLGAVGLEAINQLNGCRYQLREMVARPIKTSRFILLPLYHPSPRVVHTIRNMPQQKRDFKKILRYLPVSSSSQYPDTPPSTP